MDKKKTGNISTALFGLALILLLLPVFGVFRDNLSAVFFASFLCIINAFIIKELGK